jgi:Neutral/alkaline non-lysosomal ceramidase, N-terminal
MKEQMEGAKLMAVKLFAGADEAVITPMVGSPLLGCIQSSNGVHDDLFVRTLVLSDGAERVAIVCLDLIGMDFDLSDEIRAAVQNATGIGTTLLNCSHTHSAPFTIPWSVLGWRWLSSDKAQKWRSDLVAKVSATVGRAAASLTEAVLRVGRAPVQIGFNRRLPTDRGIVMRPNHEGTVVPWVDVLRIDNSDGNPISILLSHAAHPVIIHGASRLISADYPGFATKEARRHFGPKCIPMFAQACGANINGEPLRGGFEAAEHAGITLAKAAIKASEGTTLPTTKLKAQFMTLEIPFQELPTHEDCALTLQQAEERLARVAGLRLLDDEELWRLQDEIPFSPLSLDRSSSRLAGAPVDDVQPMEGQPWWLQDTALCLRDLLTKIEKNDRRPLRFEIFALSLGEEWCLLAMTHELFAEYQLWIDRMSPFRNTMVWAYTNGCESYIPTDNEFSRGGYEAAGFPSLDGAAIRYRHRMPLKSGVEQQIHHAILKIWG